ncbi:MAG TPA: hypothetical protein VGE34_00730 [Candidatus Saccharimonadales bacterium]
MSRKSKLAYEKISDGARFREQYRFAFSAAIIATVFVAPSGNALEVFLKGALGFSALFAALFLITSAAKVKYNEPGRLYAVFYAGERFRMWAFDWSVHVFAVALLIFIGIITAGLVDNIPGVELGDTGILVVLVISMLVVGITILLATNKITSKKSKKPLPKI